MPKKGRSQFLNSITIFSCVAIYSIINDSSNCKIKLSIYPRNPIFAHALAVLFLDHLPSQRRRPFLAEGGGAEEGVEVLIRQHDVVAAFFPVGDIVFV